VSADFDWEIIIIFNTTLCK